MSEQSRAERMRVQTWVRAMEGKYGYVDLRDLFCAADCPLCTRPPAPSPEPDLNRWHAAILAQERARTGSQAPEAPDPTPPPETPPTQPPAHPQRELRGVRVWHE